MLTFKIALPDYFTQLLIKILDFGYFISLDGMNFMYALNRP